ncbi:hypothetical protein CsSME_00033548 [Camellia sinensis var. sinensis]
MAQACPVCLSFRKYVAAVDGEELEAMCRKFQRAAKAKLPTGCPPVRKKYWPKSYSSDTMLELMYRKRERETIMTNPQGWAWASVLIRSLRPGQPYYFQDTWYPLIHSFGS